MNYILVYSIYRESPFFKMLIDLGEPLVYNVYNDKKGKNPIYL